MSRTFNPTFDRAFSGWHALIHLIVGRAEFIAPYEIQEINIQFSKRTATFSAAEQHTAGYLLTRSWNPLCPNGTLDSPISLL
jgi:hypothetical protein